MKKALLNNIKNIYGWKTKRKIVVISVDDYGNVRLDSKKARERMDEAGLKIKSRFDAYDTLETREDLEVLFNTLTSVKDKNGRHSVLTPFAMPCNIDFEKMALGNYKTYHYEKLPETYEKLSGKDVKFYKGTWSLWKEGIDKKLMIPQYHGREHLNIKILEEKLSQNDHEVLTALKNRSYTSISKSGYDTMNYTAAFDFWNVDENEFLSKVLDDGIDNFKEVFGSAPANFMPPTSRIHPMHLPRIIKKGIKYIDTNLIHKQHVGSGKFKTTINYTGKNINKEQIYLVRNVVFEPTSIDSDISVKIALDQIKAAFRWNRPAIISSHRVNFCGYIDEKNRKKGISELNNLLKSIVDLWPDVEFMSADELGDIILKDKG